MDAIRTQLIHGVTASDFDPISEIESSVSFGKFRASVLGHQELKRLYGDRIDVRFVNYDISSTILLTDDVGFFEPYVNANLFERIHKRLNTFEVMFSRKSYFSDTCMMYFRSLWNFSIPYEDLFAKEEYWKKRLVNEFEYWG